MARIFICHSSLDKELADAFYQFLLIGLPLNVEDFFYSSRDGGVQGYQDMNEAIESELRACVSFIFIVTSNFLDSEPCKKEYHTAKTLDKRLHVFLAPSLKHSDVKDTFVGSAICSSLGERADLRSLRDQLVNDKVCTGFVDSNQFEKSLNTFITVLKNKSDNARVPVPVTEAFLPEPDQKRQQQLSGLSLLAHTLKTISGSSYRDKDAENISPDPVGIGGAEAYLENLEARSENDAEVSFLLGIAYCDGILAERDILKALMFMGNAAEKGYSAALAKLADMYFLGDTEPAGPDYDMVLNYLKRAADSDDNARVRHNLGCMYLSGLGCARDLHEAEMWLQKAADRGYGGSRRYLSVLTQIRERTGSSLRALETAADAGDVEAMMQTGFYYRDGGRDLAPDPGKALYYFGKAAEHGSVQAETESGMIYYYGLTPAARDFQKAARHFEKAAGAGDPQAGYYLGGMCRLGLGRTADPAEALRWYEFAAGQGHVASRLEAGKLYARRGCPDYDAAAEMLGSAAEQGSAEAQRILGDLYRFGLGCPEDREKALSLYRESAAYWDDVAILRVKEMQSL